MLKWPISPNIFYVRRWREWDFCALLERTLNRDSKDLGFRNMCQHIRVLWWTSNEVHNPFETHFHYLHNDLFSNKWLWELCWSIQRYLVNDNVLYKYYLLCTFHTAPNQYLLYTRYSINTCRIKLNFNPSRWSGKCLLKHNLEIDFIS